MWTSVAVSLIVIMGLLAILDRLIEPKPIARETLERVPPRVARFVIEQEATPAKPPPIAVEPEPIPLELEPPAPEPTPVAEIAATPAPAPPAIPRAEVTAEDISNAREKVAGMGVLAMRKELTALRSLSNVDSLASRKLKTTHGGRADRSDHDLIRRRALRRSGGIEATQLNLGERALLAERETTAIIVTDEIEERIDQASRDAAAPGSPAARAKQRTSEEIQLTFDQHKASFYALYRRALRMQGSLEGRVVFELVIAPDGRVASCDIVSSELGDPVLERKLVSRIMLMQFEDREVEIWQSHYHIDFAPSG